MMIMFMVVLSIFIIHWQMWSQTILVDTTSGRLLGTQTDGGMSSLDICAALFTLRNPPD